MKGTDKEKEPELSTSFYQNKKNDAKLYSQIQKAYGLVQPKLDLKSRFTFMILKK